MKSSGNVTTARASFLKDVENYKVILICPECGTRYDVGWRIEL